MSLVLTLNIFYILFYCYFHWFWKSKCLFGSYKTILGVDSILHLVSPLPYPCPLSFHLYSFSASQTLPFLTIHTFLWYLPQRRVKIKVWNFHTNQISYPSRLLIPLVSFYTPWKHQKTSSITPCLRVILTTLKWQMSRRKVFANLLTHSLPMFFYII